MMQTIYEGACCTGLSRASNDNTRAYIERDADGTVIRVVPAINANPLRCQPFTKKRPSLPDGPSLEALKEAVAARQAIGDCWNGRRMNAWPTAKRLAAAERYDDLALLVTYRRVTNLAYSEPANDNWRDQSPVGGQADSRSTAEQIDNVDLLPGDIRPTIKELRELSGVPWLGDDGFDPTATVPRPITIGNDPHTGAVLKQLGELIFAEGSLLIEYGQLVRGSRKKPHVLHKPHRSQSPSSASLTPNSVGTWNIEEQVAAREQLRSLYDVLPVSSIKLLELACGPTTAAELGEAFGKQSKAAQRLGVKLIDRAIGHLRGRARPYFASRALLDRGLDAAAA